MPKDRGRMGSVGAAVIICVVVNLVTNLHAARAAQPTEARPAISLVCAMVFAWIIGACQSKEVPNPSAGSRTLAPGAEEIWTRTRECASPS